MSFAKERLFPGKRLSSTTDCDRPFLRGSERDLCGAPLAGQAPRRTQYGIAGIPASDVLGAQAGHYADTAILLRMIPLLLLGSSGEVRIAAILPGRMRLA